MARTKGGPLIIPAIILMMLPAIALGQSSSSYTVSDHDFNAGGSPAGGQTPSSASYRLTLDVVGSPATGDRMTGPSYTAGGGFAEAYLPPGEVAGIWFEDLQTLNWDAESSTGTYNVYRDSLSNLPDYSGCWREDLVATTTIDIESPATGQGYFYLVTAENLLSEEGTRGNDSTGTERTAGAVCP